MRKYSIVLTTNTPPTWPPCHVVASQELYVICMKIFIMNRTGIFQKATQRARILLADNINRAGAAVVSTTTSLRIEFSTAVARWLKPNLSTGAVKSNLV